MFDITNSFRSQRAIRAFPIGRLRPLCKAIGWAIGGANLLLSFQAAGTSSLQQTPPVPSEYSADNSQRESNNGIPLINFEKLIASDGIGSTKLDAVTSASSVRALTEREISLLAGAADTASTVTLPPVTVIGDPPPDPPPVDPGSPGGGDPPPPNLPCYPALAPQDRVNQSDIIANEGGIKTDMYVPNNAGVVIGNSGPTIGAGIDLGQQTVANLQSDGVPQSILDQIAPYTERTPGQPFGGQQALDYVNGHPLSLSQSDATTLTNAFYQADFNEMRAAYNNLSKAYAGTNATQFDTLPADVQTVLADLSTQFSPTSGMPNLMNDASQGRWQDAVNELKTGFPGVEAGREAWRTDKLQNAINSGKIPAQSNGSNC